MEQVVVIAIFAICAAVCVKILVISYIMTVDGADTKNALIIAQNAAESHKAFKGDTRKILEILSGSTDSYYNENAILVYFDANWQPSDDIGASFVLHLITYGESSPVIFADITVTSLITDAELISLRTAARRSL